MSFLELLEEQVRLTPHAVAIRASDGLFTYGELDRRATALAVYLAEHGIGPERTVGVALPRSGGLLVGLLGVLKSGAAYLPLDVSLPLCRTQHCIEDSGTDWIVTTSEHAASLPPGPHRIIIDRPECQAQLRRATRTQSPVARQPPLPDAAAYTMYTSGSTGVPKGIVVSRAALATFIAAAEARACVVTGDRVLALTTVSFDISILELIVPLCRGCEVVVADVDAAPDPAEVVRLIERHRPDVIQATPSQWRTVVRHTCEALRNIRVLVGGEPLPRDLAAALLRSSASVLNLYGPTEATVWASARAVSDDDVVEGAAATVNIGTSLARYELHVLDAKGCQVSQGVAGEIYIAGSGLARGYRNKPGLTAERFVPNPFGRPGERMYRTGDLAMRRSDDNIAFVGRNDRQVKIRGHRIELGDIEATLRAHDMVREAVVTTQPDEHRLLAYVVCQEDPAARASARVEAWQAVWESTYARPTPTASDFNIAGWQDSFTATPMPEQDMRAWVAETVARLQALHPRRVLEIGCGTGLLLTRLAPECVSYVGVDFSAEALACVRNLIEQKPAYAHVTLRQAAAHELDWVPAGSCDLIILNSVVQYFPDVAYLRRVLRDAARIAGHSGRVFVGDVRNLLLADAFHTAVQLHRAQDALSAVELRHRVAEAQSRETELLVAPAFFERLVDEEAGVSAAEVLLKTGPYDNELIQFRYDVVLTAGTVPKKVAAPVRWIGGDAAGAWQHDVVRWLTELPEASIGVRAVRDRRTARAVEAMRLLRAGEPETAGDIRRASALAGPGYTAEEVTALAATAGATWWTGGVDAQGHYDVIFNPRWRASPPWHEPGASTLTNAPVESDRSRMPALLRAHLRQRLPAYMVPAAIVELDRLPLTPNGKLDRRSLPVPTFACAAKYEPPGSAEEEVLCDFFQEVLGAGLVGVHDNFFELGGHSLDAAWLAALVRARFHVAVGMHVLFDAPTVRQLAAYLRNGDGLMPARRVVPLRASGTLPPLFCLPPVYGLSFAYAGLARELDAERPIYCLQATGIRNGESFAVTIDDAAREYAALVTSERPAGPYHLFGWSFGGLMAHAVACQLQQQGQRIAQLTVIDAYPRATSVTGRLGSISNYLNGVREHLQDGLQQAGRDDIDRLLRLTINHAMFMKSFRPAVFDGDMLLVAAQENQDLRGLWEPFVRGTIETHVIPCSHMEMMTREQLRIIGPLVEAGANAGAGLPRLDVTPAVQLA
jgi:amino acid adenylation domain-containing protein